MLVACLIGKLNASRIVLGLLLCIFLFQTACTTKSQEQIDRENRQHHREIIAAVIVSVLLIGLLVSEVDTDESSGPAAADERNCIVENTIGLPLDMFVDGSFVGSISPGQTHALTLLQGSHEFRWYPQGELEEDLCVLQPLEVGDHPGYYQVTLSMQPGIE